MRTIVLALLFLSILGPSVGAQRLRDLDDAEAPRKYLPFEIDPKIFDAILKVDDAEAPRRYVPFDIDPQSFDAILKNRLQLEKQVGSLKNLVKQITSDPQKFKLDPQMLKDLKLDDPQMRRVIKEWTDRDPELKQALKDWVKRNPSGKQPQETMELQKTLKSIMDQPKIAPGPGQDPAPLPRLIELNKPKEDPLAKIAERMMKNAENTNLGDWLRESPAWRDALTDLRASIKNPKASEWNLGDWDKKLGLPNEKAWQVGEGLIDRLRTLPRPKIDGWKVDFAMPKIGGLPVPNVNGPALPDVGSLPPLPSLSAGMSWLLFLVLFLLVAWQMYRWNRRASTAEDERASLGPWPVRPEAVSTRRELVQAFDYLALLTLGFAVKSWNHQAIAERWSAQVASCGPVAVGLALLYEHARYTEGADRLSDSDRDEARRSLLQLAEAF